MSCLVNRLSRNFDETSSHMAIRLFLQPRTTLASSIPSLIHRFSSSSVAAENDTHLPILQPSNDADLLYQILIHDHNPFYAMEASLQLSGISLTPPLLHQTLLRLRNNSKIALSLFHYSLSLPPPPVVTATTYTLLIDILSKVRQFDVCWQLIIQMDQNDIKPTSDTFFMLIRRLIAAGLTRQAIRAFDDMESFILEPVNESHFCFLLDTLCKYGYVKVSVEIFNRRKCRFSPNVRMYTVLIYGWCKIGRIDMAERFLREMSERGIEPNVVTYNVMLNGICRRAKLQPEGRFERTIRLAENVFDEMHQRGIEPDVTSFSIVLHVYKFIIIFG